MDASVTLTITPAILDWTLFGLLVAWMITFTVLALRANPTKPINSDELPTPAHSFPIVTVHTSLHVIAAQPAAVSVVKGSHDNSGEMGKVPLA
jgi:hypothetical protein